MGQRAQMGTVHFMICTGGDAGCYAQQWTGDGVGILGQDMEFFFFLIVLLYTLGRVHYGL